MAASKRTDDKKPENPISAQLPMTIDLYDNHRVRPQWRQSGRSANAPTSLHESCIVTAVAPHVMVYGAYAQNETHLQYVNLQSGATKKTVEHGERTIICRDENQFMMVSNDRVEFSKWESLSTLKFEYEGSLTIPQEVQLNRTRKYRAKLSSDGKYLLICNLSNDNHSRIGILDLEKRTFQTQIIADFITDMDLLDSFRFCYSNGTGLFELDLKTDLTVALLEEPIVVAQFWIFPNRWLVEAGFSLASYKRENNKLVYLEIIGNASLHSRRAARRDNIFVYQTYDLSNRTHNDFILYDDTTQLTQSVTGIQGLNLDQHHMIGFTPANQLAFLCYTKDVTQSKIIFCDLNFDCLQQKFQNDTSEKLYALFQEISQGISKGVTSIMASYLKQGAQASESNVRYDARTETYMFKK
jgi:hypothetical protein